jgi:hypothetical protein
MASCHTRTHYDGSVSFLLWSLWNKTERQTELRRRVSRRRGVWHDTAAQNCVVGLPITRVASPVLNNAFITGNFLFCPVTGRYSSVHRRTYGGCYRGLRGKVQMGLQQLWCQAHLAGVRESICLACRDKHRQSQSIVENCCYIQVNSSAPHQILKRHNEFMRRGHFWLWHRVVW